MKIAAIVALSVFASLIALPVVGVYAEPKWNPLFEYAYSASETVVNEGTTVTKNFNLLPAIFSINGVSKDISNLPLAGVSIIAKKGTVTKTDITDNNGIFNIKK